MVELNQYNTVSTTFLTAFESRRDLFGRLRCNFNQCVTLTGRLSSSQPNLQNIPARGELGEIVRSLFIAPEGKQLISIDLSNIEGRVVAHYLSKVMGDDRMADSFIAKVDFHDANQHSWGLATRGEAKTLLYAFIYGASATKLGGGNKKAGLALVKKLEDNMPALIDLKKKIVELALTRSTPHITTLYGRKIYYPDLRSHDRALRARAERQVVNALIQGSAADILKDLLNRSVPYIHKYGGTLLLQVHDEILCEVPTENALALATALNDIFSKCPRLTHCPIEGVAKIGSNWSEIH
jgi:DNA polymerase-1